MKCFTAVLLLALFAIVMAVEQASELKKPELKKEVQADALRDKRGVYVNSYAYPYAYSPIAYSAYNVPYAYNSAYNYPYYRYSSYYNPYAYYA